MALTVNTMANDGGGQRYKFNALEEMLQRQEAHSTTMEKHPVPAPATPVAPPADPAKDAAATPPSNYVPNSGYVGGGGGSSGGGTSTPTTPAPEATPYAYNGWKAPTLSPATDMSEKINVLYKAQEEAALKALEDAYTQSIAGIDANAAKIPGYYYEAQRMQQGADARAQQATNEYFAARGLNTGTAGQAQLAQNAVNLQNTAAINKAEADALAAVEADRAALTMDYQAQVREAIANNEMEKAAALYEEALRLDQSITDTAIKQAELDYKQYQLERADAEARAQMLASMGDFSGYKALGYTDAEVAAMQAYYKAANTPVYSGGGSGGKTPTMTFATAKQLAENGYVDDDVASVLLANGYPAEYISSYYGYNPNAATPTAYSTTNPTPNSVKGSEWDYVMNNLNTLLRSGNETALDSYMKQVEGRMSDSQFAEATALIGKYRT